MVFQHSAWPQSRPGDKHDYPLEVHRAVDAAGQEPHLHTGGCGLRQRPARAPLYYLNDSM